MGRPKSNMTATTRTEMGRNQAPRRVLETMTAIEQCPLIPRTNMANTLRTPQVRTVLDRLFATAPQDDETPRWRRPGLSWETAIAQERADASESTYMPISRQGGELLYVLVRAGRPNTVVEFGTSYGISAVYLAAAVADNGTGHVVSTELNGAKVLAARANLEEARLAERVTILLGDARTTLKDIPGPIDFVLLVERLVPAAFTVAGISPGNRCADRGGRH